MQYMSTFVFQLPLSCAAHNYKSLCNMFDFYKSNRSSGGGAKKNNINISLTKG